MSLSLSLHIYIYPWALYSLALDLLWSAGGVDKEMRGKGESEVFLGSLLVGPLVSNDFVLVMGCFFFSSVFFPILMFYVSLFLGYDNHSVLSLL